tara:strand:- start:2245 stop:3456 length:1212 start_codon:yes stop_codon:yes gene_type:complete
MHTHHVIPLHFHRRHWNIEILEYYVYQILYQIALATFNLFFPIYLIQIGYSLWEIAMWYVMNQIGFVLFTPFAGKVVHKIGMKRAMMTKLPCLAIYYYCIRFLTGNFGVDWPFALALLLFRSFKAFGDFGEDLFFVKYILKKSEGAMIAWVKIVLVLAGVLAPLLGGLITYVWGFDALFMLGVILTLVAAIPLFLTPEKHFSVDYTPEDVVDFSFKKIEKSYIVAEAGRILPDTLMWILWPVFLYTVVQSTVDLGVVLSLSAFVSILFAYSIGKRIDSKHKPRSLLKKGVHTATGCFFLRSLSLHPLLIGIIDAFAGALRPLLEVPYEYYQYHLVKTSKHPVELLNVKRYIMECFYLLGASLLTLIAFLVGEPSIVFFVVIFAAASFLILFMQRMANVRNGNE